MSPRIGRAIRRSGWLAPLLRLEHPYELLSSFVQGLSLRAPRAKGARSGSPPRDGRIGYVLWQYPTPSETFIRREVRALRAAGVTLDVFAAQPADPPMTEDPALPAGEVIYFGAGDLVAGRAAARRWLWRRPWTLVRLWLFIVGHRYPRPAKTWWRDRDVLFLASRVAFLLKARGVTHVHAPWANHYAIVSYMAAVLAGATYSVQARASEIHRGYEAPAVADRLRPATFIVTNSHYNRQHLERLLGPACPPLHVIYNGVERSWFETARTPREAPAIVRLVSVGRLVEPKGFRYLLDACDRLRGQGIPFTCEIIGAPAERLDPATWIDLRMTLNRLRLQSHVTFRGGQPLSMVQGALAAADIFVLPCVRGRDGSHDITPNSLLEAMAMGLPVVSTTSGAIPELVESERTGLLVAPNDADALAAALARLICDPPLRAELGQAARARMREHFDSDRNATARVQLFAAVHEFETVRGEFETVRGIRL